MTLKCAFYKTTVNYIQFLYVWETSKIFVYISSLIKKIFIKIEQNLSNADNKIYREFPLFYW